LRVRAALHESDDELAVDERDTPWPALPHLQRIREAEVAVQLAVHVAQRGRRRSAAAEALELPLDPLRARLDPRRHLAGGAANRHAHHDPRVRLHLDAHRPPARAAPNLVADRLCAMAFESEELAHA